MTKWELLVKVLKETKVAPEKFTGRLEINMREGGISGVVRIENLK